MMSFDDSRHGKIVQSSLEYRAFKRYLTGLYQPDEVLMITGAAMDETTTEPSLLDACA